ncbi:MAG: GNAT family N-acetyltransferase [Enhydrobacter sp.]|nr:MAG: GNAT family N-acetyltransferase [Enhydrobacter sp.]
MNVAAYSASERLRNGTELYIRALRPDDRGEMLDAVGRFSRETLYRRFFVPKSSFNDREIDFFLNIDFTNHVALVAVVDEGGRKIIAGGARYIVSGRGTAELAFAIDDAHQGQGIATHLIGHLIGIARAAGLEKFVAEVLPGNAPMLKVLERCGLAITTRRERGVVHLTLAL